MSSGNVLEQLYKLQASVNKMVLDGKRHAEDLIAVFQRIIDQHDPKQNDRFKVAKLVGNMGLDLTHGRITTTKPCLCPCCGHLIGQEKLFSRLYQELTPAQYEAVAVRCGGQCHMIPKYKAMPGDSGWTFGCLNFERLVEAVWTVLEITE